MARGRSGGRQALLDAALVVFTRRGYESATLEEIGAELGVSRSAVLYHFGSKADLLASVVAPLFDELDGALGDVDGVDPPLARPQLRSLVGRSVDAMLAHHATATLLWRDRTARAVGDREGRLDRWSDGFLRLTGGARPQALAAVRSLAALEVVAGSGLDGAASDDPTTRRLLVDMTLNVLGTKLPGVGP